MKSRFGKRRSGADESCAGRFCGVIEDPVVIILTSSKKTTNRIVAFIRNGKQFVYKGLTVLYVMEIRSTIGEVLTQKDALNAFYRIVAVSAVGALGELGTSKIGVLPTVIAPLTGV